MKNIQKKKSVIDLITSNLRANNTSERDITICESVLNGVPQGSVNFGNTAVNSAIVNTVLKKYLPYISFSVKNEKIVNESIAPKWLIESSAYKSVSESDTKLKSFNLNAGGNANLFASNETMNKHEINELNDKINKLEKLNKELNDNILFISQDKQNINASENEKIVNDLRDLYKQNEIALQGKYEALLNDLDKKYRNELNKRINDLLESTEKEKQNILVSKEKDISSAKQTIQMETAKKNAAILQKNAEMISTLNDKINETAKEISLLTSNNTTLLNEKKALNEKLAYYLGKENNATQAATTTKRVVVGLILFGLAAISVFVIGNMITLFNTVCYYPEAILLAVFIEVLLWGNNITIYANDKEDISNTQIAITFITLSFRFVASAFGGYYMAAEAIELAKKSNLNSDLLEKFTNIDLIYFGFEVGNAGLITTALFIALFMGLIEFLALPYAINQWYLKFIKNV